MLLSNKSLAIFICLGICLFNHCHALDCYRCSATTNIADCQKNVTCASSDAECFVTILINQFLLHNILYFTIFYFFQSIQAYFPTEKLTLYSRGCASKCQKNTFDGKEIPQSCCKTDLCNSDMMTKSSLLTTIGFILASFLIYL